MRNLRKNKGGVNLKFIIFEGYMGNIEKFVNEWFDKHKNVKIIETKLNTNWVFVNHDDKGMSIYVAIFYEEN